MARQMQFQGDKYKSKVKLDLSEHFILTNFINRLPIYAIMWIVAIVAAYFLSLLPVEQPVTDYAGMRAFSIAFITISTTTITFAIPTCMRAIFSTYEQYYSTKISEILLLRFPVTLLALSAFTSLFVSVAIVSGIIGVMIPVPHSEAFYVALFWTLVCVFYLFVAIEKMVYFIANAPYAVIEKLEYGVSTAAEITSKEEYSKFRQELASMNDIASTIISRSTGQDRTVTEILSAFTDIHSHYLKSADQNNHQQFKYHMNACRAVDHEIVRMFRTACSAKNEQACRNIIKTYCAMMRTALLTPSKVGYFADMMDQISRFQSYAAATSVEEIKTLASVTWFFMFGDMMEENDKYYYQKYSIVVRILSAALRQATESGEDGIIVKFLRIASNAEIDPDINKLSDQWKTLLDRAVFMYATWLVDLMPKDADRYMEYIRRYSSSSSDVFRSVLPDDISRAKKLISYENIVALAACELDDSDMEFAEEESEAFVVDTCYSDEISGAAADTADIVVDTGKVGEGQTAMLLSLNLKDTAAHTMMLAAILDRNDIAWSSLPEFGRAGKKIEQEIFELCGEYESFVANADEDENAFSNMLERLSLVQIIDPEILDRVSQCKGYQN